MDGYIERMQAKENQCLALIQQADQVLEANGFQPSKEECVFLQRAANLRYEMAQMSVGEERLYQQRKVQELNQRIKKIVRAVNPEVYKRMQENAARQKEEKAEKEGKPASRPEPPKKTGAAPGGGVPEATVESWFKEAPGHSFADVSGMAKLKEQLRECIADSQLKQLKSYLKMKQLHSYFFIGPPGCGKTYIIEAFAHELMDQNYKYLSLVGSDILSRFVGEAEKIITRLFEEAEKNAPCIVFIDEVDGVCKNRSLPMLPEYAASLTTAFLTGYNRINNSDKPIIFIGATNYPDQVDNAMLDRVELVRVPFPDLEARTFSFEKHFKDLVTLEEGFTFRQMGEATDTYNYRDIQRLTSRIKNKILKEVMKTYGDEETALNALKTGEFRLTRELFRQSQESCLPTPKEDIIKALDEWEEKFKRNLDEG